MISVSESNHSSFLSLHSSCVIRYTEKPKNWKFKKKKLDDFVIESFGNVVSSFLELIEATPSQLFEIRNEFDNKSDEDQEQIKDEFSLIGLYNRFLNKTEAYTMVNGEIYNSDYLAKKLDIVTCPYCNENTLYSFWHSVNNHERRTFDWDHIIPKDNYPFLAISFYNLVPSCKICNNLKLNRNININPHQCFNVDEIYKFQASGTSTDFLKDSKSIQLNLIISTSEVGQQILEAMSCVSIDARFDVQKELIKELLNKKYIYESPYLESVLEKITEHKDITSKELQNLLFNTLYNSSDYYKKPLSKLTRDILNG